MISERVVQEPLPRRARTTGAPMRVIAVCLGVFLIAMAMNKLAWLGEPSILRDRFVNWRPTAVPVVQWYLDHVAIPGAPIFARLVPLGEMAAGVALVAGYRVRVAAALALFMIVNFQFATGAFFEPAFFRDGTGLPVIGGLLAIALDKSRPPWSLRL
jgi:uncharacterized membrane protein YphA (DoxX/SURF4 family)